MADAENDEWFALKTLEKVFRENLILLRDTPEEKEFSIIFTDPRSNQCIVDFTMVPNSNIPKAFTVCDDDLPRKLPKFKKTLNALDLCKEIQKELAKKTLVADAASIDSGLDILKEARVESEYHQAAKAILEAEVILISTGAGWSADSGLATYPGIAEIPPYQERGLTYYDICQPWWAKREPATFYGFWGDSCNVYRETKPHDGYALLKSWKDDILMKNNRVTAKLEKVMADYENDITRDPFFSLTSNVDAHWWNKNVGAVFERKEVTEVHGNIEYWQTCPSYHEGEDNVWRLDPEFRFEVDKETMLAEDSTKWPTDPKSGTYARPCILMFNDACWLDPYDDRFHQWKNAIKDVQTDMENVKVVCIEVGCGMRVPTIRNMSQNFVKSTGATLIRINPDKSALHTQYYYGKMKSVMIKSTGLAALKKIDKIMKSMKVNAKKKC